MAYKSIQFYAKEIEVVKVFEEFEKQCPIDIICDHYNLYMSSELVKRKQYPFSYDTPCPTEKEQLWRQIFRRYSSITKMETLDLYDEFSVYATEHKNRYMFFIPVLKGDALYVSELEFADGKITYGLGLKDKNSIVMKFSYYHDNNSDKTIYPHTFTIWQTKNNKEQSLAIYQVFKNILERDFSKRTENKETLYFSKSISSEFQV